MTKAQGTRYPTKRKNRNKTILALAITLVLVFGGIAYLVLYYPSQGGLAMDWRLKIYFYDLKTGTNSTPPPGIGIENEIMNNYTLDRYGPPGYAPLSTRDTTGTIYIQSSVTTIYTFEDFFNIWGKQFNHQCVPNPDTNFADYYCTRPGETIVWDTDNDSSSAVFDSQDRVMLGNGTTPVYGTLPLSVDPHIKYIDSDNNGQWDLGEAIVYDSQNIGTYGPGVQLVGGTAPPSGTPLKTDSRIFFIDNTSNGVRDGVWDPVRLPPVMIDVGLDKERCVNQALGLSAGKEWEILINSSVGLGLNSGQNC